MTTLARTTVLALLASCCFVSVASRPAAAASPKALLLAPQDDFYLPKFGFSSFNIHGVGERVTFVHWGGLAARLGLEPGDVILSMNGFRLNYHGSWNDALYRAMSNGGLVRLRIRDVRTGHVAFRQTYVGGGGVGPITPKYYAGDYVGPNTPHVIHHDYDFHPHGPITAKSKVGSHHNQNVNKIKQIVDLFD